MAIDFQEKWTVVQLGAREHYAIARALHDSGRLQQLVTDRWSVTKPAWAGLLGSRMSEKVAGRYDSGLADANVIAFNLPSILCEAATRLASRSNWARIIHRNRWFQDQAVAALKDRLRPGSIVFAYSYAARKVLELARSVGCTTILGQIDPGIFEEELVARYLETHSELKHLLSRAPDEYWENWRRECELADRIAVNSHWSRCALIESGIEGHKISTVPLAFGNDDQPPTDFRRDYPAAFSPERPLRVLFLGQAIPRKGIHLVLAAAQALINRPVQFSIIGDAGCYAADLIGQPNVNYAGNQPRTRAQDFYREADVFLFPTLSDGFGLTQLEARHWRLPLICSAHCAGVVEHERNGWILPEVNAAAIEQIIVRVLREPQLLQRWSDHRWTRDFSMNALKSRLLELEHRIAHANAT